jgi:hypothetical protein
MQRIFWLGFLSLLLISCQPQYLSSFTILEGEQVHRLATNERIPARLLAEAGIALAPAEQLLVNGLPFPPGETLPGYETLQVRRSVPLTLVTPGRTDPADNSQNCRQRVARGWYSTTQPISPIRPRIRLSAGDGDTYRPSQE